MGAGGDGWKVGEREASPLNVRVRDAQYFSNARISCFLFTVSASIYKFRLHYQK